MARTKSSKRWLKEHFDDPWVQRAQAEGWRSRAAFKLLEIDRKDRLLKPGLRVLDLGAAPGGWSQVAAQRVGDRGQVVASDILEMAALPGVTFVPGDFRQEAVFQAILNALEGGRVDLVLSDMSPNISGTRSVDQPRAMDLAELALDMALRVLEPDGRFLVKVFQGEGFDPFRQSMLEGFKSLKTRKPEASRARSREVYLLGSGLKMV